METDAWLNSCGCARRGSATCSRDDSSELQIYKAALYPPSHTRHSTDALDTSLSHRLSLVVLNYDCIAVNHSCTSEPHLHTPPQAHLHLSKPIVYHKTLEGGRMSWLMRRIFQRTRPEATTRTPVGFIVQLITAGVAIWSTTALIGHHVISTSVRSFSYTSRLFIPTSRDLPPLLSSPPLPSRFSFSSSANFMAARLTSPALRPKNSNPTALPCIRPSATTCRRISSRACTRRARACVSAMW